MFEWKTSKMSLPSEKVLRIPPEEPFLGDGKHSTGEAS